MISPRDIDVEQTPIWILTYSGLPRPKSVLRLRPGKDGEKQRRARRTPVESHTHGDRINF